MYNNEIKGNERTKDLQSSYTLTDRISSTRCATSIYVYHIYSVFYQMNDL